MTSDWTQVTIEEITSKLGDGLHGTPTYSKNGEYYFINGNNLCDGRITFDHKTKRCDAEAYEKYQKPLGNRTILVSINGTLGNVAYYNDEKVILGKSACYFNLKEGIERRFVGYIVSSPIFQKYLEQIATGTTIKNVSLKSMREFSFKLPPLNMQKTVASVLGALDDKIENNRRMNETLEEMARAIFKSWFVDFDPVHAKAAGNAPVHMDAETAALFPSSFGDDGLPLGWNEVSADTICSITIGKTPPRKEHEWFSSSDDDVKWASIRDMGECGTYILQTAETLTAEAIKKFNVRVVPKNTVILSFKLTVGRVAITDEKMATNEAIAHFGQLDSEYGLIQREYLYAYLKQFDFNRLGSTSSIATAVNSKTIKAMPIMVANKPCRDAFQRLVLPMFSKINCNQKENQTLAELRDTLLPKLMSCEIRVKDAEQEVEAAV